MWGAIVAVLVVIVCYYLNQPLPQSISSPWVVRIQSGVINLLYDVAKLIGFLGLKADYKAFASFFPPTKKSDDARITSMVMAGVKVRMYNFREGDLRPALVFYHGGGWAFMSAEHYDMLLLLLINSLDILIVSVDYRVAGGEISYPVPLDDCLAVTKHVMTNAHELFVDPERIAVVGDSAGGNLAAAVSLRLRDENFRPRPKLQVLVYPPLQAIDLKLPSYVQNEKGPVLSSDMMAYFWSLYATGSGQHRVVMKNNHHISRETRRELRQTCLNHDLLDAKYRYPPYEPSTSQSDDSAGVWPQLQQVLTDPYFAPLLAEDVSGLPTTYIYTGQADVLRDDGLLYSNRLSKAGVSVTHVHGDTSFHGALGMRTTDEGRYAVDKLTQFLEQAL